MTGGPRLFITDELVSAEGCSAALSDAYLSGYAPMARERGMTLAHAWKTPPIDLENGVATLTFVWSVENLPGWWRARLGAAGSPQVLDWWSMSRPMIASHRRAYHEEVATDV